MGSEGKGERVRGEGWVKEKKGVYEKQREKREW